MEKRIAYYLANYLYKMIEINSVEKCKSSGLKQKKDGKNLKISFLILAYWSGETYKTSNYDVTTTFKSRETKRINSWLLYCSLSSVKSVVLS